jgi:hypothetical protein
MFWNYFFLGANTYMYVESEQLGGWAKTALFLIIFSQISAAEDWRIFPAESWRVYGARSRLAQPPHIYISSIWNFLYIKVCSVVGAHRTNTNPLAVCLSGDFEQAANKKHTSITKATVRYQTCHIGRGRHLKHYGLIAITLRYVFALSHNASTLKTKIIASL